MKFKIAVAALLAFAAGPLFAADRYTEARVYQVEASELGMYVYLQVISGDAPPVGNGGSNEPVNKPYLILTSSPQDLEARKALVTSAFVALTTGSLVRFRWDDTTNRITHLLVRS